MQISVNANGRNMREPTFCICDNKGTDQLPGNRKADQHLCSCYRNSSVPLLSKIQNFQPMASFYACTAWFILDLLRNHTVVFFMTLLIFISTNNYSSLISKRQHGQRNISIAESLCMNSAEYRFVAIHS